MFVSNPIIHNVTSFLNDPKNLVFSYFCTTRYHFGSTRAKRARFNTHVEFLPLISYVFETICFRHIVIKTLYLCT
jgi:hypothetical protein